MTRDEAIIALIPGYPIMQKVILDRDTRSKLANLEQCLELYDESGRIVGYFTPVVPERLECPYSEEELRRSSQETETYSTAEVLHFLENL
jgi:hypothetical protein